MVEVLAHTGATDRIRLQPRAEIILQIKASVGQFFWILDHEFRKLSVETRIVGKEAVEFVFFLSLSDHRKHSIKTLIGISMDRTLQVLIFNRAGRAIHNGLEKEVRGLKL